MIKIELFFKKYNIVIQLVLFLIATVFLSLDINRPLVDYDEATYAQVVTDTLQSGDVSTFQLHGQNWFEKPPLYLWFTMASVKIFGEAEYAFRIPGVLAALLCCWLVYLIIKDQTKNYLAAALGFLILLFSNSFFVFARELRLDSAVTASILAALFFWIRGLYREKYFFWVFPLIAIGVLFKSVIGLLAIPVILIYSICYRKWGWLKSKYLWFGLLLALVIILPWHILESIRFGHLFWDDYLGRQIFQRATSTMTGTNNYYDYLEVLWSLVPWI
ncbi:MAG: Dolichyl-phosphate-mannose-protein mannosyltransferase [Parcubacteria group bacterium Gr01-1014_56]|nr:MAG: Dolichyl-phosphate-mannose-protein mannosyltransferase [Parcubacteria group bacterium Gr01-1014_56]